jgi:hypothetical protein
MALELHSLILRKDREHLGAYLDAHKDTLTKAELLEAFCLCVNKGLIHEAEHELWDPYELNVDSVMHRAIFYACIGKQPAALQWLFEECFSGVFHYDIYHMEQTFDALTNELVETPDGHVYISGGKVDNGDEEENMERIIPIPAVLAAARVGCVDAVRIIVCKQAKASHEHNLMRLPSRRFVIQLCYELFRYCSGPRVFDETLLHTILFELKHAGSPSTIYKENTSELRVYYEQILIEVFALACIYSTSTLPIQSLFKECPALLSEFLSTVDVDDLVCKNTTLKGELPGLFQSLTSQLEQEEQQPQRQEQQQEVEEQRQEQEQQQEVEEQRQEQEEECEPMLSGFLTFDAIPEGAHFRHLFNELRD